MLSALIRFSLRYPYMVLTAAVLLVAFAGYRLPRMSVDVFPELNAPTVVVMAEAGGLAADEVEQYCQSHPGTLAMLVTKEGGTESQKNRILHFGSWKESELLK